MSEILNLNANFTRKNRPVRGITIPRQLINEKFIVLKTGYEVEKEPMDYWQDPKNQKTADQIHDYIDGEHADFNYGVLYTTDLMLIDADDITKDEANTLINSVPKTFMVKSGRVDANKNRNGMHIYLRIRGEVPDRYQKKKLVITNSNGDELGDIRLPGSPFYNVAPGSMHPSLNRYEPFNDFEIAYIEFEELIGILTDCKINHSIAKDNPNKPVETITMPDGSKRPIASSYSCGWQSDYPATIFDFYQMADGKFETWSDGSRWLVGSNPFCGSTGHHNLAIKDDGSVFVDRRHGFETGGLPQAIMFATGIRSSTHDDYSPISRSEWKRIYLELDKRYPEVAKKKNEEWKQKKAAEKKSQDQSKSPTEEDSYVPSPEILEEAKRIYNEGRALEYMEATIHQYHVGDNHIVRACILSAVEPYVINGGGIHIEVGGNEGSGKTHSLKSSGEILRPDLYRFGDFTDMALFYDKTLKPKTVIRMDDQSCSDKAQEINKARLSNWTEPYIKHSVKADRSGGEILKIPERCPQWNSIKNSNSDEQMLDRVLYLHADDSPEQMKRIEEKIAWNDMHPKEATDVHDRDVCRGIFSLIQDTYVSIPFADRIACADKEPTRTKIMVNSLTKAAAILRAPMREHDGDDIILATEDDFLIAAKLMNPLLKGEGGSQITHLTPVQQKMVNYMRENGTRAYANKEFEVNLGLKDYEVSKAINGIRPDHSDGLGKCIGIAKGKVKGDSFGGPLVEYTGVDFTQAVYEKWNGSRGMVTLKDSEVAKVPELLAGGNELAKSLASP